MNQHEQWECDLIAPSGAPGLTDSEARKLVLAARPDYLQSHMVTNIDIAVAKHCYAAGQAHPQGQGETVVCPYCLHKYSATSAAPAASRAAPAAVAEPLCPRCKGSGESIGYRSHLGPDDYEFPVECPECGGSGVPRDQTGTASDQPAPAAVAEPDDFDTFVAPLNIVGRAMAHITPAPDSAAKAQEPDALVQRLRGIATYRCQADREICGEAADRIEQLQAQAVADAAALRGLQADQLVTLRMKQTAEAARDQALSSLAEAERLLRDVMPALRNAGANAAANAIRAFLAQADERSKGAG